VPAQGRDAGLMGPVVVGPMRHAALSWCGSAIPADHRQRRPRCINKFQAVDVACLDGLTERGAEGLDALRVSF
jgi:hypothetical protein